MKKKSFSLKDIFITIIVTVMVCLILGYFVIEGVNPSIGDTDTETAKVEVTTSEGNEVEEEIHTYVYLGAQSKLYKNQDDTDSTGIFLDTFSNVDLAELIDTEGFPYKMEYFATTSSARNVRYLITTASGSAYWVEP